MEACPPPPPSSPTTTSARPAGSRARVDREQPQGPGGRELFTRVGPTGDQHVLAGPRVHRQLALDRVPLVVVADEVVDVLERAPADEVAPRGGEALGVAGVLLAQPVVVALER